MRIIRTLGITPYLSGAREGVDALKPSTVARKLGVHLELAKDRIARLEERGVITAYDVHPNPRLFGLADVTLHMEVGAAAKEQVLAEALRLPGVVGVYDFIGSHVCVQTCYRSDDDLARSIESLGRLAAAPRPPAAYFQRRLPVPPRALTGLDLRVLRALRRRARTPLPQIASEVGVSTRTVKRRLDRMTADGQFDVCADVDWSLIEGVLVFDLGVSVAAPHHAAALAAARAEFDEHALGDWRPPSAEFPGVMLALWARSAGEVEALRRRAEALPHVTGAWAIVASGGVQPAAWVDEALEAAIREAAAPAPES